MNIQQISFPKRNLYAIGDIHGCYNELLLLMQQLKNNGLDKDLDQLIFIGDYIDRGPDSYKIIEYLIELKKEYPNTVFLRGNHEDMMLSYLGYGGQFGEYWFQNGGNETVKSYEQQGFDRFIYQLKNRAANEQLKEHLNFFKSLEYWIQCDKFIFVHAGLSPFDSLENQNSEDLLWIREPFLQTESPFSEYTIVHGHTPFKNVCFDGDKKISIDTGCVFGGKLSCVECKSGTVFDVKSNTTFGYLIG